MASEGKESRKHLSDDEIRGVKVLDEIGFYGQGPRSTLVADGAREEFLKRFVKIKKELMDTFSKMSIWIYGPRLIMRKPWHENIRQWMVEEMTKAINEGVDQGEGYKKVEEDEVRDLLNAFEAIRRKIGPGGLEDMDF